MTKIKFCGLTRDEDIVFANELTPDYIGFVFVPKSKRYVTWEKAERLKKKLDEEIKAVGVFVNEDIEKVVSLFEKGIIDIIQLHGDEDENYIKSLKSAVGKNVIKAFNITKREDIENANLSCADMVLLDAKEAGSGRAFDWSMLMDIKRDFFLAGGLSAENIKEALENFKPYALDVSSGIETDGVKDINKMREFMRIVKG